MPVYSHTPGTAAAQPGHRPVPHRQRRSGFRAPPVRSAAPARCRSRTETNLRRPVAPEHEPVPQRTPWSALLPGSGPRRRLLHPRSTRRGAPAEVVGPAAVQRGQQQDQHCPRRCLLVANLRVSYQHWAHAIAPQAVRLTLAGTEPASVVSTVTGRSRSRRFPIVGQWLNQHPTARQASPA